MFARMKRLGAVFAAVCGMTGCGPYVGSAYYQPLPENRTLNAMQREVEDLFRKEGIAIVAPAEIAPRPQVGYTDFTYRALKDGEERFIFAECAAQKPCRVLEWGERVPKH